MKKTQKQIIVFVGGETAGPVLPLLALAKEWVKQDSSIVPVFIDRRKSVAARVIPKAGFRFYATSAGKLRRYWSVKNLLSPFLILLGIIRALILFQSLRPVVVIGAGGYVQVPVIIAAWILRIPRLIHQQDIVPSFSNRLISLLANKITVTFEKSLKDFAQGTGLEKKFGQSTKIFWTGNPCDFDPVFINSQTAKEEACKLFKLETDMPTVLVMGGGSGARALNQIIQRNLPELTNVAQIIHSSGPGKMLHPALSDAKIHDRYRQYEFIDRMDLAYAAADLVITRAGLYTITALSKLGMPSIVIPMPDSHQEANAKFLYETGSAVVIDQADLNQNSLAVIVRKIFFDAKLQKNLHDNIQRILPDNAASRMIAVIKTLY